MSVMTVNTAPAVAYSAEKYFPTLLQKRPAAVVNLVEANGLLQSSEDRPRQSPLDDERHVDRKLEDYQSHNSQLTPIRNPTRKERIAMSDTTLVPVNLDQLPATQTGTNDQFAEMSQGGDYTSRLQLYSPVA